MRNAVVGKTDEQRKRSVRNIKTWGSAILLVSFITQNFLYERWNARATQLEKGMVERAIIDKSVLLNEILYFTAQSSPGTSTDDLKSSYIHEAARKVAYSSKLPIDSDENLTTREKRNLSNSLLSQVQAVNDFPGFLALVKTVNESFGQYAQDMNLQSDRVSSKRALARNIYLAAYMVGAFLLLYAVRKE
jgi:hypothetical protein